MRKVRRRKTDHFRAEYDFSGGVRGKHYRAYRAGTNVVVLEPDGAEAFPNASSVNRALRASTPRPAPRLILDVSRMADMPTLTVQRDKGWADKIRKYRILLDGAEIGRLSEGQVLRQQITGGPHFVEAKIDWCGSRPLHFEAVSRAICGAGRLWTGSQNKRMGLSTRKAFAAGFGKSNFGSRLCDHEGLGLCGRGVRERLRAAGGGQRRPSDELAATAYRPASRNTRSVNSNSAWVAGSAATPRSRSSFT